MRLVDPAEIGEWPAQVTVMVAAVVSVGTVEAKAGGLGPQGEAEARYALLQGQPGDLCPKGGLVVGGVGGGGPLAPAMTADRDGSEENEENCTGRQRRGHRKFHPCSHPREREGKGGRGEGEREREQPEENGE